MTTMAHLSRNARLARAFFLLALTLVALPQAHADMRSFRDCPDCPLLVAIEPGSFLMGSAPGDADQAKDGREAPAHPARVERRFALGRTEVSVGEFARFVAATGHVTSAEADAGAPGCLAWLAQDHTLAARPRLQWRAPGHAQRDDHPVVCVSWHDAQAYLAWLSQRTGHTYRLPSETEWELAARAGASTRWPWGDDAAQACLHTNVADATPHADGWRWTERHDCSDGHPGVAPVGSFRASANGLHDMVGNVWEWVQDCYAADAYARQDLPGDGSAREVAGCTARGLRGGAWISGPGRTRPAYRGGYGPETRANVFGFRVARSL